MQAKTTHKVPRAPMGYGSHGDLAIKYHPAMHYDSSSSSFKNPGLTHALCRITEQAAAQNRLVFFLACAWRHAGWALKVSRGMPNTLANSSSDR